jgi:exonuclease III
MDHTQHSKNRQWKILCWNVRGLNSQIKWTSIKRKFFESGCDIICRQETKREMFDHAYLKNFCPRFDYFEFSPSNGASGGTIVIWKSSGFMG